MCSSIILGASLERMPCVAITYTLLAPFSFSTCTNRYQVSYIRFLLSGQLVLRIRDVYPGSPIPNPNNSHPESRVKKISNPGSGYASKNLSMFKGRWKRENGGSGRSQMLDNGLGPWRSRFIFNLNMQFLSKMSYFRFRW